MSQNSIVGSSNSSTSPQNVKQGTTVLVTSDVIPIIFIPGIMGSNIQDLRGNKVWDLPNTSIVDGIKSGKAVWDSLGNRWTKTPRQLQEELDPTNTKVDTRGHIAVDPQIASMGLNEQILRNRGWGTVHWDSYGKILTFLQLHLNNISFEKPSPPHVQSGFAERMLYTKQLEQFKRATAYIDNWNSITQSEEQKKMECINSTISFNNERKYQPFKEVFIPSLCLWL